MHLGKYSISDDSVIGFWFVANKTMHCITNMGVVTLVDCVIYITKLLLLLRVQNVVTTSCRLGNVFTESGPAGCRVKTKLRQTIHAHLSGCRSNAFIYTVYRLKLTCSIPGVLYTLVFMSGFL